MPLARAALFAVLILGVPTLLAYWLLTLDAKVNVLLLGIPAGAALFTLIPNIPESLHHREQRLLLFYFALVGIFTLLGGLRSGFSVAREDVIALATLAIWASPFFSVYFLVDTPRAYGWAVRLLDIAGGGIALSVLIGFIAPRYLGFQFGEFNSDGVQVRAFGPFGDQVGFPLVYFAMRSVFRGKIVMLALFCSAILLTGTRGAIISLSVGMGAAILLGASMGKKKGDARNRFVLVFLWAAVFSVGFLLSDFGATTLTRMQSVGRGESSLQQRFGSMKLGVQVLVDNPIGGVGYLGFRRLGAEYSFHQRFAGDVGGNATYTAQNQYLQSALDGGLIALVLWIAFLLCLFRKLRAALSWVDPARQIDLRAGLAWLVAMAVGNQAAVWFLSHNITTYMFVVLFAVLLRGVRFPNPPPLPASPVRAPRPLSIR